MKKLNSIVTRFRAYQMDSPGSLFSYFANKKFVLIEARAPEKSQLSILEEMESCECEKIDVLHITSWDDDHCNPTELKWILEKLQPNKIETPGYKPNTDSGKESLSTIDFYKNENKHQKPKMIIPNVIVNSITPEYIDKLNNSNKLGYENIIYGPRAICEKSNDNSTIKLFRSGSFNVLSLGDVESSDLSNYLMRQKILASEVDVLILAHHGADNGFTSKKFLEVISPRIVVASANYGNEYEHPKKSILDILNKLNIRCFTTKRGDIIIESIGSHTKNFRAINYCSNSQECEEVLEFNSKKWHLLTQNDDTIRNRLNPGFKGL